MAKTTRLGNATAQKHLEWVSIELTKPYGLLLAQNPSLVYVMQCFKEALEYICRCKENPKCPSK